MKLYIKLQTFLRLGLVNISRVALYRFSLHTGLHPVLRAKAKIGGSEFFAPPNQSNVTLPASNTWKDDALYFGWYTVPLQGRVPLWHANPFNGAVVGSSELFWWRLPDFGLGVGDIKTVWDSCHFIDLMVYLTGRKVVSVAAMQIDGIFFENLGYLNRTFIWMWALALTGSRRLRSSNATRLTC